MTIRTILVDDEPLAIQGLELRLQAFEDVEIIDTCANGREAIRKIKTEKPDLVFLDIQMPGFDGFSVVKGVMEIEPPLILARTSASVSAKEGRKMTRGPGVSGMPRRVFCGASITSIPAARSFMRPAR